MASSSQHAAGIENSQNVRTKKHKPQMLIHMCIFVKKGQYKRNIILAIHIDDGLMIYTCVAWKTTTQTFEMKVFEANMFLGLEIHQNADYSVHNLQALYSTKRLDKFNIMEAVPVSTPTDNTSTTADLLMEMQSAVYNVSGCWNPTGPLLSP